MSLIINKLSGVFGVLAILTGAEISAVQLSMYFYSLALFTLLCILTPHIRSRSPLAALSFAYLYLFDSITNILYTLLFAVSWFLVLAQKHQTAIKPIAAAGSTIDSAAGFTTPTVNVSHVDVLASPAGSITGGQDAIALGIPATEASGLGAGVLQPESATSILILVILWAIRLYFLLIVFAFARQAVRSSATPAEEPFEGRNNGEGWKGRLGRALLGAGRGYWEGNGWAPFGGNKFRRSTEPGNGRRPSGFRRFSGGLV
jgi:hypothetical protein